MRACLSVCLSQRSLDVLGCSKLVVFLLQVHWDILRGVLADAKPEGKKKNEKGNEREGIFSLFASTCLSLSLLCLPPPFSFMTRTVTVDQCVATCFYPSLFCCNLLNRLLYFPFFGTTETVMHLMISPFNQILFCRR